MTLLGYLAMIIIGLLPLAVFARIAGIEAERVFFLPTPVALGVAFLIGLASCLAVGEVLGLLRFQHLTSYEDRQAAEHVTGGDTNRRRRRQRDERRRKGRLARP